MSFLDETLQQHFAAIVEGSDDAIVAKNLDSIILSWNPAAERIFGYAAEEALGQSITLIIPDDRRHEEVDFINRLRRGERIQHFETIRRKKNGELFPVSVTISPIRDPHGQVIGASKIARDITAQHRAAEQQRLLLSEMKHRVGNSFAIAGGLLKLCARQSATVDDFVDQMRGRFVALSAAHSLTAPASSETTGSSEARPLRSLLEAVLQPFTGSHTLTIEVENIIVGSAAATPLALVFYELATNAVKYGALSQENGCLAISSERLGDRFIIHWKESGVIRQLKPSSPGQGFGTAMCEMAVTGQLDGTFVRDFTSDGLHARIDLRYQGLTSGT